MLVNSNLSPEIPAAWSVTRPDVGDGGAGRSWPSWAWTCWRRTWSTRPGRRATTPRSWPGPSSRLRPAAPGAGAVPLSALRAWSGNVGPGAGAAAGSVPGRLRRRCAEHRASAAALSGAPPGPADAGAVAFASGRMRLQEVLNGVEGLEKRFVYYLESQGYIHPEKLQKARIARRDYSLGRSGAHPGHLALLPARHLRPAGQ